MPTETNYNRDDQHTVNSYTGYQYQTTNTTTGSSYVFQAGPGNTHWKSDIYIRHSDGSETTLATDVADCQKNSVGDASLNATWNCPETSLSPTDAIRIHEKLTPDAGTDYANRDFITPQLGWSKLNAATWTFYKYVRIEQFTMPTPPYLTIWRRTYFHGNASYPARIEGMDYNEGGETGNSMFFGTEF